MAKYVSDTETKCDYCGDMVDHRSQIIRRQGQRTVRKCINCGHPQACGAFFLDKLMSFDPNKVEKRDIEKAGWLRDIISKEGRLPLRYLSEIRRLEKRYDVEV